MKIITERDLIRDVVKRWELQYPEEKVQQFKYPHLNFNDICNSLKKLNLETCSAQDIENIIGNESWTRILCDGCGQNVTWVIQLGQDPDYESNTVHLCKECFKKAIGLINENLN
jgi:hypothetical protein